MLPALFPDMNLYSLCACIHRMSDRANAAETSSVLFGNSHAGLLQDFPYALERFCTNTAGIYGNVTHIVSNATTLPYFTRFRPRSVAIEFADSLGNSSGSLFKFYLGLPASPVGAKFPLRACNSCMQDDARNFGAAYWHRSHQLPGVWMCSKHFEPLRYSRFRVDRRRTSCYILPSDPDTLSAPIPAVSKPEREATLLRLSSLSATLLDTPLPCDFTPERLRNTYFHGLKAQGLLTRQGRVRTRELINFLSNRFRPVVDLPPFDWLLSDHHINGLIRLVRRPRTDFHTTYHLLMIDSLFGCWSHFTKVYEWEAAISPTFDDNSRLETGLAHQFVPDPRAELVAARAQDENRSISSICREVGIDYQTVLRQFAAQGGVTVTRRPKILTEALRSAVVTALSAGQSQRDVAVANGISRATVDRICVETPTLHTTWRNARHGRIRDTERRRMLDYLQKHPGVGRIDARRAGNNGYSWLSRHDVDWLKSSIPPRVQNRSHSPRMGRSVNWEARDQECLAAVRESTKGVPFGPGDRIMPGTVLRKLPRLSFSPRLNRLPNTKQFITELITIQKINGATKS